MLAFIPDTEAGCRALAEYMMSETDLKLGTAAAAHCKKCGKPSKEWRVVIARTEHGSIVTAEHFVNLIHDAEDIAKELADCPEIERQLIEHRTRPIRQPNPVEQKRIKLLQHIHPQSRTWIN
jgi:hypothetical protein